MDSQLELNMNFGDLVRELRSLADKVDRAKPDKGDVKALTMFLDEHPAFWRVSGDLAEQAALIMIEDMNAPRAMKESLKAGLRQMAAGLVLPSDGELEKLIIRQIVGAWLRLSYVEYVYGRNTVGGSMTLAQGTYWERRLSAAQRRYLRALETLSRVRRLNLPTVQVNIATQQVNQVNQNG